MNNPLVSIIIPTYNRAHLIGETLGSIMEQTYENWECIILDDYQRLGEKETAKDLLALLHQKNIKVFTKGTKMYLLSQPRNISIQLLCKLYKKLRWYLIS